MIVVIGQGPAANAAVKEIRRKKPNTKITMICDELRGFYSRIDLPDIIKGKPVERSVLCTNEEYAELGVDCITGVKASKIDAEKKLVILEDGREIPYYRLLLATGSESVRPGFIGEKTKNVFTLWTMEDGLNVREKALNSKRAIVIGSGLIGIKNALAIASLGVETILIEAMDRVMPRQLDAEGSSIIAKKVEQKGVQLLTNTMVKKIDNNDELCIVETSNGTYEADFVVCAVGVRPRLELARTANIDIEQGIIVDERQCTSNEFIFAAGDVCQYKVLGVAQTIPAIWPVAVNQGFAAACNMLGKTKFFEPEINMNSVSIADIAIVSYGDVVGVEGDTIEYKQNDKMYKKLIIRDNKLKAALCIGNIENAGVFGKIIQQQVDISKLNVLSDGFDFHSEVPKNTHMEFLYANR